MKTYLWLDDIRDPFIYSWQIQYMPSYNKLVDHIVWVKNYNEFVNWIETNGLPDKVFFDHDLGPNYTPTGYDAAKWLGNYCLENNVQVPEFRVQSANPVGAENIRKYLFNVMKHMLK
jgi:hypothetical protein